MREAHISTQHRNLYAAKLHEYPTREGEDAENQTDSEILEVLSEKRETFHDYS